MRDPAVRVIGGHRSAHQLARGVGAQDDDARQEPGVQIRPQDRKQRQPPQQFGPALADPFENGDEHHGKQHCEEVRAGQPMDR